MGKSHYLKSIGIYIIIMIMEIMLYLLFPLTVKQETW